jgi:hypothetical protein
MFKMGFKKGEIGGFCGKKVKLWLFQWFWRMFKLIFTGISDVSMSIKPDTTGHEKMSECPIGQW